MKKRIITGLLAMVLLLGVAVAPAHAVSTTECESTQCECYIPIIPYGRGKIIAD